MAVFRCKMCGGDLDVTDTSTNIFTCKYCSTQQTIPTLDSEKKVNLFPRANRLRMNNEFDKAAGIYETIASEFIEEAEAYWGLCLCKYGIEYVDDPVTAKKIPTCHRTSYQSIFDDENFITALQYSDADATAVYHQCEALYIIKPQENARWRVMRYSPKGAPAAWINKKGTFGKQKFLFCCLRTTKSTPLVSIDCLETDYLFL